MFLPKSASFPANRIPIRAVRKFFVSFHIDFLVIFVLFFIWENSFVFCFVFRIEKVFVFVSSFDNFIFSSESKFYFRTALIPSPHAYSSMRLCWILLSLRMRRFFSTALFPIPYLEFQKTHSPQICFIYQIIVHWQIICYILKQLKIEK